MLSMLRRLFLLALLGSTLIVPAPSSGSLGLLANKGEVNGYWCYGLGADDCFRSGESFVTAWLNLRGTWSIDGKTRRIEGNAGGHMECMGPGVCQGGPWYLSLEEIRSGASLGSFLCYGTMTIRRLIALDLDCHLYADDGIQVVGRTPLHIRAVDERRINDPQMKAWEAVFGPGSGCSGGAPCPAPLEGTYHT